MNQSCGPEYEDKGVQVVNQSCEPEYEDKGVQVVMERYPPDQATTCSCHSRQQVLGTVVDSNAGRVAREATLTGGIETEGGGSRKRKRETVGVHNDGDSGELYKGNISSHPSHRHGLRERGSLDEFKRQRKQEGN